MILVEEGAQGDGIASRQRDDLGEARTRSGDPGARRPLRGIARMALRAPLRGHGFTAHHRRRIIRVDRTRLRAGHTDACGEGEDHRYAAQSGPQTHRHDRR